MTDPYTFGRRQRRTIVDFLGRAIQDEVQADLIVRKPDGERQVRRVSVVEINYMGPSERVLTWDHAKNGYRTFKIDDVAGGGLVREPWKAQ
jgi:predicted DNA-binding transcriptional regulator YafY